MKRARNCFIIRTKSRCVSKPFLNMAILSKESMTRNILTNFSITLTITILTIQIIQTIRLTMIRTTTNKSDIKQEKHMQKQQEKSTCERYGRALL